MSKARAQGRSPGYPRLLGGRLCLDFVNTVEGRTSGDPTDFLNSYDDLPRWGHHAGALDEARRDAVADLAPADPTAAAAEFRRARRLREDAYELLSAGGDAPAALPAVDSALHAVIRRTTLTRSGTHFGWRPGTTLGLVTDLVGLDLLSLLTSPDAGRVKRCPGCDDCGWLFVDTSRNGSRQWCSMEGCGSRAKMRRQYRRRVAG